MSRVTVRNADRDVCAPATLEPHLEVVGAADTAGQLEVQDRCHVAGVEQFAYAASLRFCECFELVLDALQDMEPEWLCDRGDGYEDRAY